MAPMIRLSKYHCYGNDFLISWNPSILESAYGHFAQRVCRRHQAVGADGCVFLRALDTGDFSYRIYNQDGSEARMSGNGARCASAFLHHRGLAVGETVRLRTRSGIKAFQLIEGQPPCWTYRADMGKPDFDPRAIPFVSTPPVERLIRLALAVGDEIVPVTALSMGNPQCQVIVDKLPGSARFQRLGPLLERHSSFPDRANVGFVRVDGRNEVRLKIWERGVGPTHSSGTGACSAAVAAIVNGLASSPVRVVTDTGAQIVEWKEGESVFLTGEAVFVADIELWDGA